MLAADRTGAELDALQHVYERLGHLDQRPSLLVATYFGEIEDALPVLAASPVEAIGLDLVAGPGNREALARIGGIGDKTLVAGVVDGRNVWRADLGQALSTCASLLGLAGQLTVSTSCSLQHVPLDLDAETALPPGLTSRLAFARQKLAEVVTLGRALTEGRDAVAAELDTGPVAAAPVNGRSAPASTRSATARPGPRTRSGARPRPRRAAGTADHHHRLVPADRARSARPAPTARPGGSARPPTTASCGPRSTGSIALQEEIGLDVLVHGESERNDMVQYFGEQLDGFAFTEHGWVQTYGSRYVRPPIMYGDVRRPGPMTVALDDATRSPCTGKPMKGMLTGPVTMLHWSLRARRPAACATPPGRWRWPCATRCPTWKRPASAIIQIDEPALREGSAAARP